MLTGLGANSPVGESLSATWARALNGVSRTEPIPDGWNQFAATRSSIWAPSSNLDLERAKITRVDRLQHDRTALLAIASAEEALDSAALERETLDPRRSKYDLRGVDHSRTGVIVGTGIGGAETFLSNHANQLLANPIRKLQAAISVAPEEVHDAVTDVIGNWIIPARFNPYVVSMTMPNAIAPALGIRYGLRGINSAVNAACASSTIAVGRAYEAIRDGQQDLMLTGGSESLYDPYGALFRGFDCAGTLAHGDGDPKTLNRPFDKNRSGFLFSEGGSTMMVLESLEHARKRGAPIIAEIIGFAQSFDAYSMMAMEPGGPSIVNMLNEVCEQAGVRPSDVSYINAHGTGTELNDKVECEIIEHVFGKDVLVNSTKSLVGHLLGASGALEIAITAMSVKEGRTHPCANLDDPIADLNFARSSEYRDLPIGLSQSFAFGGNNACVMLKRFDEA